MRDILNCQSLAEMAITLVVLSVFSVFPLAIVIALAAMMGVPTPFALAGGGVFWLTCLGSISRRFIKTARSWPQPRMNTREFFYFQMAAGAFLLLLRLAFPEAEVKSTIGALQVFFGILFLLANVAYVGLAIVLRLKVPMMILTGFATDCVVSFMPLD